MVLASLVLRTEGVFRKLNDVDATMTRIAEQRDIANEVAEAISAPMDQQDEVIYYSWTSTTGIHDAP